MKHEKKRINIYITQSELKQLKEIKYKYHISISTIANIITSKMNLICSDQINETYLYEKTDKDYKTCITPRNVYNGNNTKMFTNSIKIFCKGEIKKYCKNDKQYIDIKNMIYNEFVKTYDENWDGDRLQRQMPKMIKQNRNYYKRILEEC